MVFQAYEPRCRPGDPGVGVVEIIDLVMVATSDIMKSMKSMDFIKILDLQVFLLRRHLGHQADTLVPMSGKT